jgi:hypothetical protein
MAAKVTLRQLVWNATWRSAMVGGVVGATSLMGYYFYLSVTLTDPESAGMAFVLALTYGPIVGTLVGFIWGILNGLWMGTLTNGFYSAQPTSRYQWRIWLDTTLFNLAAIPLTFAFVKRSPEINLLDASIPTIVFAVSMGIASQLFAQWYRQESGSLDKPS